MATYAFLSDEWLSETRKLREEFRAKATPPSAPPIRMNLVINSVPFDSGTVQAHLDTTNGEPEIEIGHLPSPELTVTVDYATAKSVLVDGNMGAAMEAMQLGRIRVDGDMMKLMSLAGINADAASIELAKAIRSITA
jgi:putative sterol carrier protein